MGEEGLASVGQAAGGEVVFGGWDWERAALECKRGGGGLGGGGGLEGR